MVLDLAFNKLTELPPEIGKLSNLNTLVVDSNSLKSLPAEINNLDNLTVLSLVENELSELPSEIGQLENLIFLHLWHNRLASLPVEFGNLSNLSWLDLNGNQLSTLPSEFGQLGQLCHLDLQNNQFQYLPYEIGKLERLSLFEGPCTPELDLDVKYPLFNIYGNPLIDPPPEVIEQGTSAILAYLRNKAWWHTRRLIASGATGFGLLAVLILGLRWRMRHQGRTAKRKHGLS